MSRSERSKIRVRRSGSSPCQSPPQSPPQRLASYANLDGIFHVVKQCTKPILSLIHIQFSAIRHIEITAEVADSGLGDPLRDQKVVFKSVVKMEDQSLALVSLNV